MNIALIAHDKKKDDLVNFAVAYRDVFDGHTLYATGTTGRRIIEATGLSIQCVQSGPLGGDQQLGALVATDQLDLVLFFRDPLTAQPHEPDITALIRLCDVHHVPVATNMGTAEILVYGLQKGKLLSKEVRQGNVE
ncbi:methylglyoxal synthase [Geomicrobium sediminis]|uniref:Methylglyoxal synthase n=1 Tax=Geomicrobium sediminis TaxID=1347788 RepID=A0ABS2PEK6_9BACL|nr:methylglyoxal synthase [Geomicrobium sediminis]EZH67588.1 methylglyoxal synthase [Bacillaceae bacterium JMAK1]MBM7633505.1 methylglyoxal synthase [Geomicrobium sediminis]